MGLLVAADRSKRAPPSSVKTGLTAAAGWRGGPSRPWSRWPARTRRAARSCSSACSTQAERLTASRPAVGAIAGAVGRLLATAHASSHLAADELRRVIEDEGNALICSRDRAGHSIAIQIRPRLEDALVVTHSASATVREALLYSRPARVVCTVSAPFEEGRAFADELRGEGLEVELVDDDDGAEALDARLAPARRRGHGLPRRLRLQQGRHRGARRGRRRASAFRSSSRAEVIKLAPIGPGEALEQIQRRAVLRRDAGRGRGRDRHGGGRLRGRGDRRPRSTGRRSSETATSCSVRSG